MSDVFFFDPNHPPFYQLISFTTVGTHTFNVSDVVLPNSSYEIDYFLVTCYGGGEGGDRAGFNAQGGRDGGRVCRRLSPLQVGSSQAVTVGAGGLGRTGSSGQGSPGGISSFGNLVESRPNTSVMETILGPISSSAKPGSGGASGTYSEDSRYRTYPSGAGYTTTRQFVGPGYDGESSSSALGGQGAIPNGWFGSSVPAGAGFDGETIGWYTTGGAGGGGGTGHMSSGANGGVPGGGGGGSSDANGGNGGRGQVDVLAVFKPRDLSGV